MFQFAGDEFEVVASLDAAWEKAEACAELLQNEHMSAKAGDGKVTLSSLAFAVSAGKLSGLDLHQLNIILKVDLQEQVPIGSADVRAVFSSGSGRVAGCMVIEGKVVNGCGIRVIRNVRTDHVGVLDSLRRVKEIVKEVNAGLECCVGMDDFEEWQEGDVLEAFKPVQKKRTLGEASASMAAALEGVGIEL